MNLKDLNLSDLIKIAITATIAIALTLNLSISSNNTTTIVNNYNELSKKVDVIDKKTDEQSNNITKIKTDVNQSLILNQKILKEVK